MPAKYIAKRSIIWTKFYFIRVYQLRLVVNLINTKKNFLPSFSQLSQLYLLNFSNELLAVCFESMQTVIKSKTQQKSNVVPTSLLLLWLMLIGTQNSLRLSYLTKRVLTKHLGIRSLLKNTRYLFCPNFYLL